MGTLLGLALGIAGFALKILITVLAKLRLLPAFLFLLITQICFSDWAYSIGDWYKVIAIALIAVGLGSFIVQGIMKLRKNQKLENAYVERLAYKFNQQNGDGLHKDGWYTKIY